MPDRRDRRLELIQPLRGALLPIPANREGQCLHCAGAIGQRCSRCDDARAVLGILPPIHSVAVAVEGEQLNRALARYKSDGVSQVERFGHTRTLGAMLSLFVERHANCLGEFDAVVAVPSPTRCAPGRIIDNVVALSSRCITPLERVTPKSRSVSRDAYRLTSEVRGTRLLVVDDTFVTGASMFSACHTLRDGGAEIVGCLAVGRQVKTTWSPSAEMLKWLRKVPWDPDRCRVCGGAVPPGSMF